MSTTRNEPPGVCNRVTNGITKVVDNFYLKPGEPAKLLIPIGLCVATAGFYAFPSVAYALFTHSLLPTYALRALGAGTLLGVGNIIYGRLSNTNEANEPENNKKNKDEYIALVKMHGEIDQKFADSYLPILSKAFKDNKAKGVVIKINSPGGSPVQSSILYNEILKLKDKYHKRVVVVGEDCLASGAYYIASSADSIYVNANTMTGSIGAISKNYGFSELAKKWGIEPRTYTAGAHKNRLDPLLPEDKEDVTKTKELLSDLHQDFMDAVLARRKEKLKGDKEKIFSGDVWSGKTALDLGLVDAIGNFSDVMQKEFDVSNFKEYKSEYSFDFLNNLSKFASNKNVEMKLSLDDSKPQMKM